jgi:prevent-host-death family protein
LIHSVLFSDLRNKFPEIEETVVREGNPVFLTKNGYEPMVVMRLEKYAELADNIELKLDEDALYSTSPSRR